jgi:hypothetical protein
MNWWKSPETSISILLLASCSAQNRERSAEEGKVVSSFSCRRVVKGRAAALCCRYSVLWLVLAFASQSSFAQTGLGDWTSVQNLPLDSAISVKTKRGDKYHGELVKVTRESLTIDSDERGFPGRVIRRRELRREDIKEVRFVAQLASALAGAAIGAGVGGGIAAGLESTAKSKEDRGLAIGTLAILGSLIGLAIAHHYPFVKGKLVYVVR